MLFSLALLSGGVAIGAALSAPPAADKPAADKPTAKKPAADKAKGAKRKAAAAAFGSREPLKAGNWLGEGDGLVLAGIVGFVQEGKTSLVVSNPALHAEQYLVNAEMILPTPAAGLRIDFAAPSAKGKSDAESTVKPLSGLPLRIDADGKTLFVGKPLNAGKRAQAPAATPEAGATPAAGQTRWPVLVAVTRKTVQIAVGPIEESRQRADDQPVSLHFSLSGGARIENLRVAELANTDMLPLVEIHARANATARGASAAVGRLDAGSLPRGLATVDGVEFMLPDGPLDAIDVAQSMSGVKDPFRNKTFMLGRSVKYNGRTAFTVPGDQYAALHVLAFSAGREGHAPRMTVRVGHYGGAAAIMEDTVVEVPLLASASSPPGAGRLPVTLANGQPGFVHHLRIPLPQSGNVKEFRLLDLEFTRDMNTHVLPPDPNEFGQIPAGPPSDVVLLAATLEPSPVTMTYTAEELGNVFFDTQKVVFHLTLANRSHQPARARAVAVAQGPGTGEEVGIEPKTWSVEGSADLAPGEKKELALDVTPGKRGWFACQLGVEVDGRQVQRRDTTFAVLAPDTRQALDDSPFGVWEFWNAHSVAKQENQTEILASLMLKAGWRWTYGGSPVGRTEAPDETYRQLREKYKITWNAQGLPNAYQRKTGWYDEQEFQETVPRAIAHGLGLYDPRFKVMHESRTSNSLLRHYSEYLGGQPYDMPSDEKKRLEEQFENVKKYCLAVKRADPRAGVVLFNDYPSVVNQFLSRGFPAEAFDVIGLEGAMFLRQPERQPDWLCLLGHVHEMKRLLARFGYQKPIWTTEALYHPTEAGALSLHQQAVISVREAMMALELGIQRMAAAGIVKDPTGDYHWSNWGSAGFCFRDPEINPKPSYAMYAWLTQILDQAKPAGKLPTPNDSLHVVRFLRREGGYVQAVWTAGGVEQVTLAAKGSPVVYDAFGNTVPIAGAPLTLTVSPTPQYIVGATLEAVIGAAPIETAAPGEPAQPILDFDDPKALPVVEGATPILESNWDTPRLKGAFETAFVREDGASALRVKLQPDADERKLLPRYVAYRLAQPIKLPGRPYEFVARVKGAGGWGQILFELVDAKGRVWTSCGNQYAGASNAADTLGNSFVNFIGWRTMRIPIVGMYPGRDQSIYWPSNYNYWPTNSPEETAVAAQAAKLTAQYEADLTAYNAALEAHEAAMKAWQAEQAAAGAAKREAPAAPEKPSAPKVGNLQFRGLAAVDYPLTLTKIMVALRPHILYMDEERAVADPAIFIDNLGVSQPPPGM